MNTIERIERQQMQKDVAPFNIGDTVQVHVKVIEGDRERTQIFEGNIIARRGRNNRRTITVRKVSYGVGVERVFPVYSPYVQDIKVLKSGKVRRAKLFYIRNKKGRAMRIMEKDTVSRGITTGGTAEPTSEE